MSRVERPLWWENQIPRLRVLIEDLNRRLDKMGNCGTERRRVLEDRVKFQFELDNALRAAELHRAKPKENQIVETRSGSEPSSDTEEVPKSWNEVEISFISDERVQIRAGCGIVKTYNYTELGFEDSRNGKPNLAWEMLRYLGGSQGFLERPLPGSVRAKAQKRLQEIRNALRKLYKIESNPIPFNGVDYQASFKISRKPSFDT
jgi:hypothetical protein